jgi:hypothetical protein
MRTLLWLTLFSFECFSATKFVDLNTGYTLNLNLKASTYTIHDQKIPAEFCGDDSTYVCMKSIHVNFAIPKKPLMPDEWEFDGITYCYIDNFDYISSNEEVDEAYLVAISANGLCNGLSGKELRFLYGKKVGLIYIDSFSTDGYQRRFMGLK